MPLTTQPPFHTIDFIGLNAGFHIHQSADGPRLAGQKTPATNPANQGIIMRESAFAASSFGKALKPAGSAQQSFVWVFATKRDANALLQRSAQIRAGLLHALTAS
jgi:hypothetical protein